MTDAVPCTSVTTVIVASVALTGRMAALVQELVRLQADIERWPKGSIKLCWAGDGAKGQDLTGSDG